MQQIGQNSTSMSCFVHFRHVLENIKMNGAWFL